jgi:copper chaperone NosL
MQKLNIGLDIKEQRVKSYLEGHKVGHKEGYKEGHSESHPEVSPVSPVTQLARQPTFQASALLLVAAAAMLVASVFLPYWRMRLNAPQYPNGLFVTVYVNHMAGDIREIDGLNHYIGMAPLEGAAQIERSLAPLALGAFVLMIVGLAFIHRKWAFILALPAMSFPFVFLADMWVWLWYYGNHLDPTAALSSAVKPFTPTILGTGHVGQFSTTAWLLPGWYLALLAAGLTGAALWLRWQAHAAVRAGTHPAAE